MAHNLEQCVRLVSKAAAAGAKVLFLPEASDYIATSGAESLALAKPVASSPFVTGLQSAAAKHSLAVHVGIHVPVPVAAIAKSSVVNPLLTAAPQPSQESSSTTATTDSVTTKLYNRTIWINEDGSLNEKAAYDKLHLFDYATLRESANTQAGAAFTPPFPSALGRIGSLICFDLRFPEAALYLTKPPPATSSSSALAQKQHQEPAQILLYPSAFTVPTGRAHWEVLLRSRAIETQSWVIAAAQVGRHGEGARRVSYGRSMVVDPWGRVVVELKGVRDVSNPNDASEGEEVLEAEDGAIGEMGLVDIDLGEWEQVRQKMPLVRRT
ncbi:nitrilase and fragile histidine triad fusion protein hit protein [Apiospora saccharicola]|uniref:Nitrilase and fragile histidine triad fusion protein hit protein n=1 Tax=Apiospora saccharicola TaxID=335842 RepID=A0ABR1W2T2_9PEZI